MVSALWRVLRDFEFCFTYFSNFFFQDLAALKLTMSESTQVSNAVEPIQEEAQPQFQPQPISPSLKCLVIDTNAIINGVSLRTMAEEFYTCPEVLYELRSAHSKEFLSRLPFELKVMNPTEEAMKTSKLTFLNRDPLFFGSTNATLNFL